MTDATESPLWARSVTLEAIQDKYLGGCERQVGIVLTAVGPSWLEGHVPAVRATQDASDGQYHGAMAILAETLASIAANLCLDGERRRGVGQILDVHYFEPVARGPIVGRATAVSLGKERHIWEVDMKDQTGSRVSSATVTMAILEFAR